MQTNHIINIQLLQNISKFFLSSSVIPSVYITKLNTFFPKNLKDMSKMLYIINMALNTKLLRNRDAVVKSDEFYTIYSDIEDEVKHYTNYIKGKTIYCNCDSEQSNFVKYFQDHKDELNIKLIYTSDDFRSHVDLIKNSDIIITNPPYSLLSEFITLLLELNKDFLIIGGQTAITYKDTFKALKDGRIRMGYNTVRWFYRPNGDLEEGTKSQWFTTLPVDSQIKLKLYGNTYNPEDYPTYDKYPAIEVSRTKKIPIDYNGVMGVPISYLQYHDPEQFEILDIHPYWFYLDKPRPNSLKVKGQKVFSRVLIKKRK